MAKHIYGCKKDIPDLRDQFYSAKVTEEALATSVDLRSKCSPIVDQGNLGCCSSCAIASGLREFKAKAAGNWKALSRLFHYWEERKLEGTISTDSGATISDGMKVLKNIGVCPETDWPYDISTFKNSPTQKDLNDAPAYKISSYQRVTSLSLLKAAIAEDYPVVIGVAVYASFEGDAATSTGIIPMPDTSTEKLLGYHAICCVGYNDNKTADGQTGYVIFRNSWGTSWGAEGYGYLPYAYFNSLVTDMWTSQG